jgi:hypothetical protein
MTKLLEEAVAQLRELPEEFQNKAARQLARYVEEINTDDRLDVDEGRLAYERGDFVSIDQWRNEMGLGDH